MPPFTTCDELGGPFLDVTDWLIRCEVLPYIEDPRTDRLTCSGLLAAGDFGGCGFFLLPIKWLASASKQLFNSFEPNFSKSKLRSKLFDDNRASRSFLKRAFWKTGNP